MKKMITMLVLLLVMTTGASAQDNTKVYTTSGKKYHTHKECQYVKNSPNVKQTSKAEAEKQGKELCSRCKAKDAKVKEQKKN